MNNDVKQKTDNLKAKFKTLEQRHRDLVKNYNETAVSLSTRIAALELDNKSFEHRVIKLEVIVADIEAQLDIINNTLQQLYPTLRVHGNYPEVMTCDCEEPCITCKCKG